MPRFSSLADLLRMPLVTLTSFETAFEQDCLDHFVVLGEEHLRYLVAEFVLHYNTERPHQNTGNLPPGIQKPRDVGDELGQVLCDERLGGLLKHYYRKAA